MIADIILGAFAVGAGLYQAQKLYGSAYDRRTARLRETREDFYAAAHAMLLNPALDERHLRFVQLTAEHVTDGNRARMHLWALRKVVRAPAAKTKRRASQIVPPALLLDLGRLTRTAVYAIAEREPLWKFVLLRTYRQALMRLEQSPGETVSAIEEAFGDCLPTAA